jgi:hypothetical protein
MSSTQVVKLTDVDDGFLLLSQVGNISWRHQTNKVESLYSGKDEDIQKSVFRALEPHHEGPASLIDQQQLEPLFESMSTNLWTCAA